MRLDLLTEAGKIIEKEVDYIVIKNKDGEMAILKNHIPIIVPIDKGFIKCVHNSKNEFIVIEQAILEFKNNIVNVLSLEAVEGNTLLEAQKSFEKIKKEKLELTKKENIDFSKLERELKENIKKGKAGQL